MIHLLLLLISWKYAKLFILGALLWADRLCFCFATNTTTLLQQPPPPQTATTNSNQYLIRFIHNDTKNNYVYVSILPVNNKNQHDPRIELRYQSKHPYVSLDERTPNNTVVAAVLVRDEDSGPNGETTVSIEQGNELGHFKLVSTQYTNTIQVNGAPLSKQRTPEYNLTIVARDHGSPPRSSSVNLVIILHASAPSTMNPSMDPLMPSRPPGTEHLMYVGATLVVIFATIIFLIIIGCCLVQRPKGKKRPPPPRTTSASNSRIDDQCFCLGPLNL